jgi:ATP/maltotriose-dependent transcriptional regulator MalT
MATLDQEDLEAIGDLLDARLSPVTRVLNTLSRKVGSMDKTAEELKNEIATLATEEGTLEGVVATAGTKFADLQKVIEGLRAGQPLTDAEITALQGEASAIAGHLGEAATHLTAAEEAAKG